MNSKDSWITDGPGLSLSDALDKLTSQPPFKRSEDKRGHDAPMGTRFPKDVARWLTRVKEAGQYQTTSDAIRDAVWLGLQILSLRYEEDPEWQVYLQLMRMSNEAAWAARIYEEEEGFANTLETFCKNDNEKHAIALLEEKLGLIQNLKEEKREERKRVLLERLKSHRLSNLLGKVEQL